jgi:preprotein translocase subunit YajC
MNPLILSWAPLAPLAAAAAPAQPSQQTSIMTMLLPLLIMFAVIYLLVLMPQRKRQRQRGEMLSALKKNDDVITVGGIHGTVTLVRDRDVVLQVGDDTRITFSKTAIAHVVRRDENGGAPRS